MGQAQRTFTNSVQFKKWVFNASGFNQYGLYHDDALYETEDVIEALKRIPPHLLDERAFRIQRAIQCSVMKTVLPKDQGPHLRRTRRTATISSRTSTRSSTRGRSVKPGTSSDGRNKLDLYSNVHKSSKN